MSLLDGIIEVLRNKYLCDNCLGRCFANLLSGLTNEERGKIIRHYLAFLFDSGEQIDIDPSNFHGIKFRNRKVETKEPRKCSVCGDFFKSGINRLAEKVMKKIEGIEFDTFLIGSIPTNEMLKAEEKIWETIGTENIEIIKSEINRELGKKIEELSKKKFSQENPDLTIVVDLNKESVRLQIRSLFVFGKYKKLVRGIPQSKWVCPRCRGKGCVYCKGEGKLYPTSVQEIIEKPLLKATKARKSRFSGEGREDIDARCLDFRPFVIELVKPLKRRVKLRRIQQQINKSKKVEVKGLRLVGKHMVRVVKTERSDKTYLAEVTFKRNIDLEKLKELKKLTLGPIRQRTPLRVLHRRANKIRRRSVKRIVWEVLGKRKLLLKMRCESGLYVKELINGDEGRTKPSVSELLNNKVKKIRLDVIKIHTRL